MFAVDKFSKVLLFIRWLNNEIKYIYYKIENMKLFIFDYFFLTIKCD